jgi:hypothetical protein
MTAAEKVAELMGDDGTVYNRGPNSLDSTARSLAATVTTADYDGVATPGGWSPDSVRYEFNDGSAIVDSGDGWDIEGPEPWTWRSEEQVRIHWPTDDDCDLDLGGYPHED